MTTTTATNVDRGHTTTTTCPSGKLFHATRDEALDLQKRLVARNHATGNDSRSERLHCYPCDECRGWHVGHHKAAPLIYHYDTANVIPDSGVELRPDKPYRVPRALRRKYTGFELEARMMATELVPLIWFSWDATWDMNRLPHPGTFLGRPATSRMGEGLVRIALPSYVAKLRWSDYLLRNKTHPLLRNAFARLGDPSRWLATDQPVPSERVKRVDVWYRDSWVDAATLDDKYDQWLAAQQHHQQAATARRLVRC